MQVNPMGRSALLCSALARSAAAAAAFTSSWNSGTAVSRLSFNSLCRVLFQLSLAVLVRYRHPSCRCQVIGGAYQHAAKFQAARASNPTHEEWYNQSAARRRRHDRFGISNSTGGTRCIRRTQAHTGSSPSETWLIDRQRCAASLRSTTPPMRARGTP